MQHPQNEAEFQKLVNSAGDKLVVAKFGADWCPPCRALAPELEKLASQRKDVLFVSVNVDQFKELSGKLGIKGIPDTMFFKNGKMVSKVVGMDMAQINKNIEELAPKNKFSGAGISLGGQSTGTAPETKVDGNQDKPSVDPSKPVTQIFVRLHSGAKVPLELNLDHKVKDIYNYCAKVAPTA